MFVSALAVLVIILAYLTFSRILPTIVSANMEETLSRTLGQKVSIGTTSVKFFPGIVIDARNVFIGNSGDPFIRANQIKVWLSPWHALFGRVRISILKLEQPRISLDYDAIEKLRMEKGTGPIPVIMINDGSIGLRSMKEIGIIDKINGIVRSDQVKLSAEILGGEARLTARKDDGWKGVLSSENMNLSQLAKEMGGTFETDLLFNLSEKKADAVLNISGKHLKLPWAKKEIETVHLSIGSQGDNRALALDRITLTTPQVQVRGSGRVTDLDKGSGAYVKLAMSSGVFDYEQIVDFIPLEKLDTWLSDLLSIQIRGGQSRFSAARYEGTLEDLLLFKDFIDHIDVDQEILGQSFCAQPGLKRITGITGQVHYGQGNIILRNLSGSMNGSKIEKVTLSFFGIFLPYWKIGVDTKLDMPAKDFLDTWNAAGMPYYVYDLFADLSHVQEGRVRCDANFYWDESKTKTVQVKGWADLNNCTYQWGESRIRNHTGSIIAKEFGTPLQSASRMTLDSRFVKSLDLVLADPFDTQRSSFQVDVEGLVDTDNFRMDKGTVMRIRGTGIGPDITATAEIRSENVTLFGTSYQRKQKPLLARAKFTGKLWPKMSITMKADTSGLSPETLSLSGTLDSRQGNVRVRGLVGLDQFTVRQSGKDERLSGKIQGNIGIRWDRDVSLDGSLLCRRATVYVKNSPVTLDGPVAFSGNTLASKRLRIRKGGMRFTVSEGTLVLSDHPFFTGDVTVEGLKFPLEGQAAQGMESFKSYTARGRLRMLDLDFHGIRVSEAQADAALNNGILSLTDLNMKGPAGSAKGTATIGPSGVLAFDTSFSAKQMNIRDFLRTFSPSPNPEWIRGEMDLEGHLWGRSDSINGSMSFITKKGKIQKYALISRIFALLNFYKIVQARDLELTSKNFPYNVISSTFTIKDSIVHFDDFALDSNSLQLSAVGDYSLKTRNIDAIMGVQPFETIDRAIHAIPLLGWVLTGDKGKLIVVSMKVKGNIDDPSVQLAPAETISNPVKSSLIRALRLPSEIMGKTRDLFPNSKKN